MIKPSNLEWSDNTEKLSWYDAIEKYKDNPDGWRLPTKEELKDAYKNKIGGFTAYDYYWSSSDNTAYYAWYQYFGNGAQLNYSKNNTLGVRVVREIKDSTEWNGEGLPPIGAEVEFIVTNKGEANWLKARVIHIHKELVWLEYLFGDGGSQLVYKKRIRPIQNKEQEAIEDMKDFRDSCDWQTWTMDMLLEAIKAGKIRHVEFKGG